MKVAVGSDVESDLKERYCFRVRKCISVSAPSLNRVQEGGRSHKPPPRGVPGCGASRMAKPGVKTCPPATTNSSAVDAPRTNSAIASRCLCTHSIFNSPRIQSGRGLEPFYMMARDVGDTGTSSIKYSSDHAYMPILCKLGSHDGDEQGLETGFTLPDMGSGITGLQLINDAARAQMVCSNT